MADFPVPPQQATLEEEHRGVGEPHPHARTLTMNVFLKLEPVAVRQKRRTLETNAMMLTRQIPPTCPRVKSDTDWRGARERGGVIKTFGYDE